MNAYGFMDDSSSVIPPSLAVSSSSGVQGDGTVSNPVRLNADTLSSGTVAGTDNFVTSSSGNLDGQLTPVNTVPSFVLRGDTGSDTVNLTENVNILGDTNTKIKTEITGANELTISLDTTGATLGQIPAVNVSGGISFVTPSSGITNLSTGNITTTTLDIVSDTGADATLPSATVTTAGLMSAQDKVDMASLLSNQHIPATVTDGQSIDLTITGQDITAELVGLASASLGQVPTKNGTGGISWVTPIVTDDAIEVNYDNTTSGLTATDIQSAIDEMIVGIEYAFNNVEGRVDTLETGLAANTAVDVVQAAQIAALQTSTHAAATVNATSNPALTIAGQDLKLDLDVAGSYNNTTSGLASTSVQDAIDELASQTTSGANNGLSVSADKTVLGQDVGQAGNPAQLTSNREIPTNNFNFTIGTGSTTTGSRSFNIGRNQSLSGVDSYIIGNSNTGNASDNIYAFGELNNVSAAAAVAVGISNQVSAGGSLAFGRDLNNSVPTTLDLGMSASSYLKMSSTDIKLINITPTSTSTTLENLAIDTSNGQVVRKTSTSATGLVIDQMSTLNQSIPSGAITDVNGWSNTPNYQSNVSWNGTTGTATIQSAGWYDLKSTVLWDNTVSFSQGQRLMNAAATVVYALDVRPNGTSSNYWYHTISGTAYLNVGDTVKVFVEQYSGSNKNIFPFAAGNKLSIFKIA